jgi:hypothetical protein
LVSSKAAQRVSSPGFILCVTPRLYSPIIPGSLMSCQSIQEWRRLALSPEINPPIRHSSLTFSCHQGIALDEFKSWFLRDISRFWISCRLSFWQYIVVLFRGPGSFH